MVTSICAFASSKLTLLGGRSSLGAGLKDHRNVRLEGVRVQMRESPKGDVVVDLVVGQCVKHMI